MAKVDVVVQELKSCRKSRSSDVGDVAAGEDERWIRLGGWIEMTSDQSTRRQIAA